jgi:uncharacterized protein (DUF58 family)
MEQSDLLKRIRRIEIHTKKIVQGMLAGDYHSVFRGQGMEFEEVAEYTPGDDIKNIDWNVTARSDQAYVKRYTEERELTVVIAIDASASQQFGTQGRTKQDLALEVSACLAFSALQNKDKVALLIFTDEIELFLPPQKSRNHVLRIIREIAKPKVQGTRTDINQALEYLNRVLKRKAIVFFVSDFLSPLDYQKSLKMAAYKHDFVAIHIEDQMEHILPEVGMIEVVDPETGEIVVVDTNSQKMKHAYEKGIVQMEQERLGVMQLLKIDSIKLQTHKPYLLPLIRFFKQRSRRR